VVSSVLPAPGPITVADTRYALSRHRFVKGILTGPTTLSFCLRIATPVYRDRADLAKDLARALAVEAKALASAGVCMLQVDEPILSTGAAEIAKAEQALEPIARSVGVPVSLHVCGDLSAVIDRLLTFPVDVLDIECAKSPQNLDLISGKDLGEKRIAVGCVDSTDPRVEDESEIARRIRTAIDRLGAERLLIDPDCGLRMLPLDSAKGKLARMVQATKQVRGEIAEETAG